MVQIVAKGKYKPTEIVTFLNLARELTLHTRQEVGCISYKLCQDQTDPTVYAFIEEWQDEQAIDSHNNSSHFKSIVPQFNDLLEIPMEVSIFKIVI